MYENANEKKFIKGDRGKTMNVRIVKLNLYDFEDAKRLEDVYRIELPYGFISDVLKDEIDKWNEQQNVFIAADTGLGKNTFVERCLIPYTCERHGKILLLMNRVALNRQEKKRLAGIFGMEELLDDYTDKGLDNLTEFGCLTVMSYQQLEAGIRYGSPHIRNLKEINFDFVVMDEAHYFMTDSGFNAMTDMSLEFLCEEFDRSVKIYMTATPQEIFPLLKVKSRKKYTDESGENYYTRRAWLLYEFAHDYNWLEAKAFDTLDDLADIIQRSEEKWLVFVNSIKMGRELQELLDEGVVITAESKNRDDESNPHFLQVVNDEQCHERVVITTAVLENGVNIKDHHVRNIAIFSHDKIQFLQMLGRVRRYPGARLKVYIANADMDTITKCCQSCRSSLKAAELFGRSPVKFYDDYIVNPVPRANVRGTFTIMKKGYAHFNVNYQFKKALYDLPFWESIIERSQNGEENVLLKEKFSWLGKEFQLEDFEGRRQFEEALNELKEYLEEVEGKEMKGDDKDVFSKRFSELYKNTFGKRKEDKSNDQIYKAAIIKNLLEKQKLCYILETKREGWILNRKMGEEDKT